MPDSPLTTAALARLLGVAPATVRSWERRYGLGPSARDGSGYRRYSEADVSRFQQMRDLVARGASPGRAAAVALGGGAADVTGVGRGGNVLALPGASPAARGLAAAAMALDGDTCHALVVGSLAAQGVVATWEDVVLPVLVAVGERWAARGDAVDVEHLLAEVVIGCLAGVARDRTPNVPGDRPVLLVGADGEGHGLPLHALGAALREQAVPVRFLGTGAPAATLASAVARTGPGAVVVWSQTTVTADPSVFAAVPSQRPPVRTFAAGPGWDGVALPRRTSQLTSLRGAVDVLAGLRVRSTTARATAASAP